MYLQVHLSFIFPLFRSLDCSHAGDMVLNEFLIELIKPRPAHILNPVVILSITRTALLSYGDVNTPIPDVKRWR